MTKSERKKKWRREHLKEVAAYAKKYRAEHKDEINALRRKNAAAHPEKNKIRHYNRYHGEPIANKVARLEAQGYKCANPECRKPIDLNTGKQDHNHLTEERRGVLCDGCNKALGFLQDSAKMAKGLASYRDLFQ